ANDPQNSPANDPGNGPQNSLANGPQNGPADSPENDPENGPANGPQIGPANGPENGFVEVGALARHAGVERDAAGFAAGPRRRRAPACVAHPAIRNRGTTVGSLVHADPAAELPAVLALLAGSVQLASAGGTRTVPAAEFFRGPLESAVRPGELAVAARFPGPARRARSARAGPSRPHGRRPAGAA